MNRWGIFTETKPVIASQSADWRGNPFFQSQTSPSALADGEVFSLYYFLKLSFKDTLRLNTRCSAVQSRLSMQK